MKTKVVPYADSSLGKKDQVAAMFNNIAGRYDFLNRFLSLGIDRWWRRRTVSVLSQNLAGRKSPLLLDVATGTADLAIACNRLQPAKIFGVDISEDMLKLGRQKVARKGLREKIELLEGDSERLIFEDNKFDGVTVGFGVRNFENLEKGLTEIKRVLRPGGSTIILEFSKPQTFPVKQLYRFYASTLCPWIGRLVSRDEAAYSYLHESVEAFPSGKSFCQYLEKAGFTDVRMKPMTFGIVTIYSGKKST